MSVKKRFKKQLENLSNKKYLKESPPIPKLMHIELSNACNHACLFCSNPLMQRKKKIADDKLVYKVLNEARDIGVKEVGLYSTGEPFIFKELDKIISHCKKLKFEYIFISSNGAMATPDKVVPVINAGLDSIKFSINAATRKTYKLIHQKDDWTKVIKNLNFIKKYILTKKINLKLYASYVVMKQNIHEKKVFLKKFENIFDEIMFHNCDTQGGQMNEAQKILSVDNDFSLKTPKAQSNVCTMPFNRFHISAEGYLTMCCVDYHNYLAISDLNNISLEKAWYSSTFEKMRKKHLNSDLSGTLCGNCWYNRNDKIKPLKNKFAHKIDYEKFYDSQKKYVNKKVQKFTPKNE